MGGMPVLAGGGVAVSGWVRAAATARSFQFGAFFYDVNGNFVSSVFGPSNGDATTGWSFASGSVTAPANGFALPVAQVLATGGAAEIHYVDDVTMSGRGSVLLQTQIFTVTGINPPFVGVQGVNFTPAAAANTGLGTVTIQPRPPRLSAPIP